VNYATVCSGVEAMSLAVNGMGWKPVFFSEIEPFPCQLLKTRFTHVPNLGDMTKIEGDKYYGSVDVLAGGTPCQSFSVAGKRGGLADGRGQLMLHFVKLAYDTGAPWVVWENVPGCLSSGKGEDFAALLSSLCGVDVAVPEKGWANSGVVTNADGCYGVAWRVLDAQYTRVPGFPFAVPQRRRRVWLVGYLGDWRRAAEVLFVGEGLPWHFEAGERAGQEAAGGVADRAGTASGFNFEMFSGDCKGISPCLQHDRAGDTLTYNPEVANCLQTTCDDYSRADGFNMVAHQQVVCYENHANDSRVTDSGNLSPTITSRCGTGGGNLPLVKVTCARESGQGYWMEDEIAGTLRCEGENRPSRPSNVIAKVEPVGVGADGNDVGYALRANPSHSSDKGDGGMNCTMVVQPIAISDVVHGDKACNGKGWNAKGAAYTLDTMATQGVCVPIGFGAQMSIPQTDINLMQTLQAKNPMAVCRFNLVRRLTPTECERLMGFPDFWTRIKVKHFKTKRVTRTRTEDRWVKADDGGWWLMESDSPRYKACGNSWAVNCARWVMMRIQQSEDKHT